MKRGEVSEGQGVQQEHRLTNSWTPAMSDLLRRKMVPALSRVDSVNRRPATLGGQIPEVVRGVSEAEPPAPERVGSQVREPVDAGIGLSLSALWTADDRTFLDLCRRLSDSKVEEAELLRGMSRLKSGEPRTLVFCDIVEKGGGGVARALRRKLRVGDFFLRRRAWSPRGAWDLICAIGKWHINELVAESGDENFLNRAYGAVLGRVPDRSGKAHFLEQLGSGATRLEVLIALQASEEGRLAGPRVAGLSSLATLTAMSRWAGVRHLLGFMRLPGFVNASIRYRRRVDALAARVLATQAQTFDVMASGFAEVRGDINDVAAELGAARMKFSEVHSEFVGSFREHAQAVVSEIAGTRGDLKKLNMEFTRICESVSEIRSDIVIARAEAAATMAAIVELRASVLGLARAEEAGREGLIEQHAVLHQGLKDLRATVSSLRDHSEALNAGIEARLEIASDEARGSLESVAALVANNEAAIRRVRHELSGLIEYQSEKAKALEIVLFNLGESVSGFATSAASNFEAIQPQLDRLETYSFASARRFAVPCGDQGVLVRTDSGYVVCPQLDAALVSMLVEGAPYEPGTSWVISSCLSRGDMFIDVGANVGLHTLVAARAVGPTGRVHAFEAHPHTASCLSQTIWMNGLADVVAVHAMGLSDASGSARMFLGRTSGHHSFLPLEANESTELTSRDAVTLGRLDDLLVSQDIPALIKLDVEGFELKVLAGSKSVLARCHDVGLVVELGLAHLQRGGVTLATWLDEFASLGFRAMVIDDACCSLKEFSSNDVAVAHSMNLFFAREGSQLWSRLGVVP
jgi:FkbM family methyltransferase